MELVLAVPKLSDPGQLEDAERVVDRVLEPPTGASEAHTFYLRAGIAARAHWEVAATVCRELDMQPWL
jgi:hypothetical protein